MSPQQTADILLARWQAQRSMPPGLRVLDGGEAVTQRAVNAPIAGSNPAHPAIDTFERDLEIIRQVMERK